MFTNLDNKLTEADRQASKRASTSFIIHMRRSVKIEIKYVNKFAGQSSELITTTPASP